MEVQTMRYVMKNNTQTEETGGGEKSEEAQRIQFLVHSGLSGRIVSLLSSSPAGAAKFMGDTANLINDMLADFPLGRFKEYGHIAKMLSPFQWIAMTDDLVFHLSGGQGLSINHKFYFRYLKTTCDTYQALAYMTSSVALGHLSKAASMLKHATSAVDDLHEISKIVLNISSSGDHSAVGMKLLAKISDLLFRICVLELIYVCAHLDLAIKLLGFAAFLVDNLAFESGQVESIRSLNSEKLQCETIDFASKENAATENAAGQ